MKTNKIISIILLIAVIFSLYQCQKNIQDKEDISQKDLNLRTNYTIGGEVGDPSCDISIYDEQTICSFDGTKSDTLIAQNGCQVIVTMDIWVCGSTINDDIFVDFRNLRWRLLMPASQPCLQWWISLMAAQPGVQNTMLDGFIEDIEQKFENAYMEEWIQQEEIYCDDPEITVSSFYFKSPCIQRCTTPPSEFETGGFFSYDFPCADDGCCVKITSYCIDRITDELRIFGPYIEPLRPCTNFITVECRGETIPMGGCRDNLCDK
jgi:hypothetical protein